MPDVKRVSTLVLNHVSWSDIVMMLNSRFVPSFAAKKSLRKKFVVGFSAAAL